MQYVYDIFLNFLDNYYEFYEWKNDDRLVHIKKIYMIRLSSLDYNIILNKNIAFSEDFMFSIFNKCEYFNNKKIVNMPYAVLLTDTNRIMGIIIKGDGTISKYSSLMLEDEEDLLGLSNRLASINIKYKIIGDKEDISYKTRAEIEMINYIKNDLNDAYQNHDLAKLKYLYYEFFALESDDIEQIQQDFLCELKKDIGEKHYNLYHLISLSKHQKTV